MPAEHARPAERLVAGINRRRLRTRIVLSFFLLGFGLTVLFAYATNEARRKVENALIEDVMNDNIDEYARRWLASNDKGSVTIPFQQMVGQVVKPADFEKLRQVQPQWVDLRDGIHTLNGVNDDGSKYTYKLAVRKTADAWFFLAYDMTRAATGETKIRWVVGASIAVFGLLSLILGMWSASKVMRPVSDLVNRIRRRNETNDSTPLASHFVDDEVGELAAALDDYATRLQQTARRERELNADVSHELRTPLSVIASTVELMLTQPDLSPKMLERVQRIQRAQESGTAITRALLNLSREERESGHAVVAKIVEQLLDANRTQMKRGKVLDLRMEGNTALVVDAPDATVYVAVGNLIANAVKYTLVGSVTVRINENSVDVIDTGPGLSIVDEKHMADRGFRGDAASNTQGGGIGLSIVTRICELYGWRMQIANRNDGMQGTRASLLFSV